MSLVEIGLPKFQFHSRQLALKDGYKKVAATAGGFKEAGVDPLGFALHKIKHGLHHPRRGEDFAVVGDTFFRTNEAHVGTIANLSTVAKRFQSVSRDLKLPKAEKVEPRFFGFMGLSRIGSAPLIAFTAPRETDYGTEPDGRIAEWRALPLAA